MTLSPDLQCFLAQMEYPATKDDLLREARRDGVAPSDLAALHDLPDVNYGARCQVITALDRVGDLVAA